MTKRKFLEMIKEKASAGDATLSSSHDKSTQSLGPSATVGTISKIDAKEKGDNSVRNNADSNVIVLSTKTKKVVSPKANGGSKIGWNALQDDFMMGAKNLKVCELIFPVFLLPCKVMIKYTLHFFYVCCMACVQRIGISRVTQKVVKAQVMHCILMGVLMAPTIGVTTDPR